MSVPTDAFGWCRRRLLLEWRLLASTRTPWLVAALFLLTSAAALVNGHAVTSSHRAAAARAVAAQVEQHAALARDLVRVEDQRTRAGIPQTRLQPGLPSAAAVETRVQTFRAALPPLATGVLSAGRTQLAPQRYEIRGGGSARFWPFGRTVGTRILSGLTPEPPLENPAAAVMGGFDPAFVAVYLYPLLILTLMYDVVSRDRETGTLALIAAQPTTFRSWLAMRVAVRGAVIGVCGVLLPTVAAAATMTEWSGDVLVRLGLWTAGVLAYCAIWAALAAGISVHVRTSALGAVIAVSVWLLVVMVYPACLRLSVPLLTPTSMHLSYATAERAASLEINARVDTAIAALNQLVRRHVRDLPPAAGDHPTFTELVDAPVGGDLLRFPHSRWHTPASVAHLTRGFAEARRVHVEQRLAPALAALDANERLEATLVARARLASPGLLLQMIGDDISGTGRHRWAMFLEQLDGFVRQRDAFFTGKILGNANVSVHELDGNVAPFRHREETSLSLLCRVAPALAVLCAAATALVLFGMSTTRQWHL